MLSIREENSPKEEREDIEGWLEPTSRRIGVQRVGTKDLIPNQGTCRQPLEH